MLLCHKYVYFGSASCCMSHIHGVKTSHTNQFKLYLNFKVGNKRNSTFHSKTHSMCLGRKTWKEFPSYSFFLGLSQIAKLIFYNIVRGCCCAPFLRLSLYCGLYRSNGSTVCRFLQDPNFVYRQSGISFCGLKLSSTIP